jgi:two-component system, LytTR family, response regulator
MQLNSIIVDDEKLSRDLLSSMLEDLCPHVKVIAKASTAEEANETINYFHPDVVFMDIEMQGNNSFELFKDASLKHIFQTVFVTGYSKYSINAVKAGAIDFLLKPLDADELKSAVSKLYCNHLKNIRSRIPLLTESLDRKLVLPHFSGFKILSIRDIIHLDADNHYTFGHLVGEPITLLSKSIKYFEEKLNNFWFFRIHKSHIINFYHFREYLSEDGGYAVMSNGKKIPVSKQKIEDFFEYAETLGIRI